MNDGFAILYPGWTPFVAEVADDLVSAPLRRLAGLLDTDAVHWPADALPPLAHWLYFLPEEAQARIGADGHPERGGVLPPVAARARMWAGGRIAFHAPLLVGAAARRRSIAIAAARKEGRSGILDFVTLRHEVIVGDTIALVEEQDLVFRAAAGGVPPAGEPDRRISDARRTVTADITQLFRFSALTFNAHRIHYDRAYATGVEGYPGLVVHGPYQAMLLADHLLRHHPGARLSAFAFRGVRPLFADSPFTLHLAIDGEQARLWTRDHHGHACMEATATLA